MSGSLRILGLVAVAAGGLLACEPNEPPFRDDWSVQCTADGFPAMTVWFRREGHVDDRGRRRRYVGEVSVGVGPVTHYWLWEVAVHVGRGTAETIALEPVPIPDAFVEDLEALALDVETYAEAEDTESAEMTGTCAWGDRQGDLVMRQFDDCDACPNCSTVSLVPGIGVILLTLLAIGGRNRRLA